MSDLNHFTCNGRLVRNAELSYFQDGTPYCKFSLGNNKTWKDQSGEYQSISSYFDFVMKGKYAESMAKYLLKGRAMTVEARAKQQRWESDGQKFSKVVFEVENLQLWPTGNNSEESNNYNQQQKAPSFQPVQAQEPEPEYIPFDDNGEEIPF